MRKLVFVRPHELPQCASWCLCAPVLTDCAAVLLSSGSSSLAAAAECNWSAWGRSYTSLQYRLNNETVEKLVYVKANALKQQLH